MQTSFRLSAGALAIAMLPAISTVGPLFDMWRTLGLYDTWARFTVITARAKRTDGNTPKAQDAPAAPTTPSSRARWA